MNNDLSKIKGLFSSQLEKHSSLAKSTHGDRKQKLKRLLDNFMSMEQEAIDALSLDMKKSPTESIISEVLGVKAEAKKQKNNGLVNKVNFELDDHLIL